MFLCVYLPPSASLLQFVHYNIVYFPMMVSFSTSLSSKNVSWHNCIFQENASLFVFRLPQHNCASHIYGVQKAQVTVYWISYSCNFIDPSDWYLCKDDDGTKATNAAFAVSC